MERIRQIVHGVIVFFGKSHRGAHLIVGFLGGLFLTFLFAVGFAVGMEAKEVQADRENTGKSWWKPWTLCWRKWDWIDVGLTVGGGVIGSVVRWLVVGCFM